MKKLLQMIVGVTCIVLYLISPDETEAETIAKQDQNWADQLNSWSVLQELGNNLSGTVSSFAFRIRTTQTNLNQFDHTAQNSKIYDKDNNNFEIVGCIPTGTNPTDPLRGLAFSTSGVPPGFKDVTLDFSCRNYNFTLGHRYLIRISNANMPRWGGKRILFAASAYGPGGHYTTDQFTLGGLRYAFDSNSCSVYQYIWNSQTANSGCNIWTSAKDDLYFILTNTTPPPPPPRLPVIFIPGIGGSEMKAGENIFWADKDDGHGGKYSHAYAAGEKIWVNSDEAVKLGDDDYFDVLRLKADGQASEADISLTGDLTSFGYSGIDSFFTGMGYEKGKNFFTFPYDWRKDIRSTKDGLDNLIETAKQKSGQSKVNLVVHSMGGLVGRYFISDPNKASKVNKLIELGVPHLGATRALQTLMYGNAMQKNIFGIFPIGIPANEVKDVFQNLTAGFQLLPSQSFFNFYNNSADLPYPFRDDRDIDNDKVTGALNFNQTKSLLSNLNHNMTVFGLAEEFHSSSDPQLNQTNGTKVYEIVGTSQPTLGQIHETWWITWPINLINKTDEIYINGDGTVPLYSASLKNDSLDISGATKIYYVEQEHGNLVSLNGTAMQTVKALLNDDNALPVEVKDQKISLEGEQLSLDDGELDLYDDQNRHCGINDQGEIEENIPDVTCTTSDNTKHAFVKKKAKKIKITVTRKKPAVSSKTTNLKKRTYRQDKIIKTAIYKDLGISQTAKIEFAVDPNIDTSPSLTLYPDPNKSDNITINPTSEVTGSAALDQTPPATAIQAAGAKDNNGNYDGPVTITLTASDSNSGILRVEYSLDNGQTVQTYTEPITLSTAGETTIQVKAIDNLGNEEIPQSITIEIAAQATPTPTPIESGPTPSSTSNTSTTGGSSSSSNDSSSSSTSSTSEVSSGSNLANTSEVSSTTLSSTPGVLSTPGVDITAASTFPVIANPEGVKQSSLFNNPTQIASGYSPRNDNGNILGITFENPRHIADQINISNFLDKQKNPDIIKKQVNPAREILGGLLMVSGGIVAIASLGLILTFNPGNLFFRKLPSPVKPFPK